MSAVRRPRWFLRARRWWRHDGPAHVDVAVDSLTALLVILLVFAACTTLLFLGV